MSRNYEEKLLKEIITGNYELVYQSRGKCEIYRDTGVSKNTSIVFIEIPIEKSIKKLTEVALCNLS